MFKGQILRESKIVDCSLTILQPKICFPLKNHLKIEVLPDT